MLAAADEQRHAVGEGPDAAVGPHVEPDAAQGGGGLGHQRAALERVVVAGLLEAGAGGQALEAVALQLGAGPALEIDDEHGALAVEQQRCPLGGPDVLGVAELQPGLVDEDVGHHHAVGELVGLDPGAAELDEELDRSRR